MAKELLITSSCRASDIPASLGRYGPASEALPSPAGERRLSRSDQCESGFHRQQYCLREQAAALLLLLGALAVSAPAFRTPKAHAIVRLASCSTAEDKPRCSRYSHGLGLLPRKQCSR